MGLPKGTKIWILKDFCVVLTHWQPDQRHHTLWLMNIHELYGNLTKAVKTPANDDLVADVPDCSKCYMS